MWLYVKYVVLYAVIFLIMPGFYEIECHVKNPFFHCFFATRVITVFMQLVNLVKLNVTNVPKILPGFIMVFMWLVNIIKPNVTNISTILPGFLS